MKPDLFSIGRFTVHTYGLMIAIGIIVCVAIAMQRAKKKGLNPEDVINLVLLCLIIGYAGAKLTYALIHFKELLVSPKSVLGSSGFVVYGGIIVGLLVCVAYSKKKKQDFRIWFDHLLPSVAIAQGFGRIGCLFAGCCYGKPTDAWWGITFTQSYLAPNGVSLIPTQILMAIFNFVVAFVLLYMAKKNVYLGDIGAVYILFFGTGRFIIEYMRANIAGGFGPFTTAQWFSFVFWAAGILILIWNRKGKNATRYNDFVITKEYCRES